MRKSDILKLLEENLAELERYIEQLWNFLPVAACLVSPVNCIFSISNKFKELSGYKETEIVGQDLDRLFVNKNFAKALLEQITKEGKTNGKEAILLTKDKKEIPVNISAMQRKDEEGTFIGYFLSIIDISEIKKNQNKLEKKIEELERFRKFTIGRELRMVELKKESKKLKEELEKYKQKDGE